MIATDFWNRRFIVPPIDGAPRVLGTHAKWGSKGTKRLGFLVTKSHRELWRWFVEAVASLDSDSHSPDRTRLKRPVDALK